MNEEKDPLWGTLEDLLLACAVDRHGQNSWELVAEDIFRRISGHRHSPAACRRRYTFLRKRFIDNDLVAELKNLRIDELRSQVERHNTTIEFLKSKVKKLEDGKEEKTDLSSEPVQEIKKPDEVLLGDGSEGNESNTIMNGKNEPVVKPEDDEPTGLALNRPKRKVRGRFAIESSSEDEPDVKEIKSQALIKILAIIRAHKSIGLFEKRRSGKEFERYKRMVLQHVDLQTIQHRLDKGFYLQSQSKFFRDLLLLFTNAITFFSKNTNHYTAASELREIVIAQMAKTIPKQPDQILTKPKIVLFPPLVVCRRRSSKPPPNYLAITKGIKEVVEKRKVKNPKFDVAKERVIVKKPGVKVNYANGNNKKKSSVKEKLSSSDESDDDVDETKMGNNTKGRNKVKIAELRDNQSSRVRRRGTPAKGSLPIVALEDKRISKRLRK